MRITEWHFITNYSKQLKHSRNYVKKTIFIGSFFGEIYECSFCKVSPWCFNLFFIFFDWVLSEINNELKTIISDDAQDKGWFKQIMPARIASHVTDCGKGRENTDARAFAILLNQGQGQAPHFETKISSVFKRM